MATPVVNYVETGQRFGRGVVINPSIRTHFCRSRPGGFRGALLRCDCGAEYEARIDYLLAGRVVSCGCKRQEAADLALLGGANQPFAAAASVTHGMAAHPLYPTWKLMLHRCENPRRREYPRYGGRGISVCARWHDVRLFVEDIDRDLGSRPEGMTLDRIDNDSDYQPGNVRWATAEQQAANRGLGGNGGP